MRWVNLLFLLHVGWTSPAPETQAHKIIKVLKGQSVKMTCNTPDTDTIVVWMRQNSPVFVDEVMVVNEDRYSVDKSDGVSTMTIRDAEPLDDNIFVCQYHSEPRVDTTYKVVVHSPPSVTISPEQKVYDVVKGMEVVLGCHTHGHPSPVARWERKGARLSHRATVRDKELWIKNISEADAGIYVCTGTNDAGSDHAEIDIQVNDGTTDGVVPWVKSPHTFVPVVKGDRVVVNCSFDGTPVPQLEWFFNGYKINFSSERFKNAAQFAKRERDYSLATLVLENIDEETFGDYMCRASNKLGSEQKVVHVSGRPGPAELQLEGEWLRWTLRSKQVVIEYALYYRQEKVDAWSDNLKIRSDRKGDHLNDDLWQKEYNLRELLEPGTKYELQLRARNALGWGPYAREFITAELASPPQAVSSASILSFITALTLVVLRLI